MTRQYTSSGYRDDNSTYHYGITIPHNKPTTGVITNNTIEWLSDETMDGIDLSWEEWLTDFESEHGREPNDDERDEANDGCSCSTYLIGDWTKDKDGQYEPVLDGSKGFSAIVGEIYTQVVWSKTTERCALCSPCFPGQADVGTPGDYDAYTLPTDLMGFNTPDGFMINFLYRANSHAMVIVSNENIGFYGRTITPPVIPQTD